MRLKEEPKEFRNQREAYWYQKGLKDAKETASFHLQQSVDMATLEWLDHLPTGEELEEAQQ